MAPAVMLVLGVLLPMLLAAAYLLGRHLQRRQNEEEELSPVTRQHIDLFQGGQLSEAAVESAKDRIRDLLEQGDFEAVEESLRPGMSYVVQVRALTELGTDDAGRILERQLQRRLSDDQIEQSWYWIDVANGLRSLNRPQSLPQLLRCAESASDSPLGHYFAAETICFLGFGGYVNRDNGRLNRSALRVLHRALEGLRMGVPPIVVAEARVGEIIENLWDRSAGEADPLAIRIYVESLRLLRRAPHAELVFSGDMAEQEAFNWQMSRLSALESSLEEYLRVVPMDLCAALNSADVAAERDILLALADLKADVSKTVQPLLEKGRILHTDLAVDVLGWSRDPGVGGWLRAWAVQNVPIQRRTRHRRHAEAPRRPSVNNDFPYRAILRALRGHGSPQTEAFLVMAAHDWDPIYRSAALASLGWWEPYNRSELLSALQEARRDPNTDVRQAARAALARLGERSALHWFRQNLTSEEPQRVHEGIQTVAGEGLTLLWPDLDQLADSEDVDIAHHAREAIECLAEDMEYRRK